MTVERVTAHPCPTCGALNDAVTGIGGSVMPVPGDVSLCVSCLAQNTFVRVLGALAVRPATAAERADFARDQPVIADRLARLRQSRAS